MGRQRRTQVPLEQNCVDEQERPHAPQLLLLVRVFTSQPSDVVPLQLAKPALQEPMRQEPLLQLCTALARAQTRPQPPQWFTLLLVLISQPLTTCPSQFAKPELQLEMPQVLALQTGVPLAEAQVLPQAPQFERLLVVLTSQPLDALPSQSAQPALQT